MPEPDLERVVSELGLMATHGQLEWRVVPGADVTFLVRLRAVQRELATSADGEIGPDAALDAIVAAVDTAIDRLAEPYRGAAIEQFGTLDDPKRVRKKGPREEAAAAKLGVSVRMYEKPTQLYGGISRREHLIRLLAESLCEPAGARSLPALARRLAPSVRVLVAAGAVALVGFGAWALAGLSAGGPPTPLVGSVLNASTGTLFSRHPVPEPASPAYGALVPGSFLHPCDPALGRCPTSNETPAVKPGDTITIRLFMTNRYSGPIPWLKLLVSWEPTKGWLNAGVTWPARERNGKVGDGVQLQLTDHGEHRLEYVPGSTALYSVSQGAEGRRVARLPDGIMGDGLELVDLGPPGNCADCIAAYARVVTFEARVK